ncbi:unnamed protein product [Ambrosiozyma monospora]|uniref:Unnamed protein product n=1 Tax=Ambrosiozyma monospora TaxID=43982 RepID=A0ACB5U9A3_AMBMO|nr:unnamed protein product [Ambrosiozyma monospora]
MNWWSIKQQQDLVSQLSNDELNHIDDALTSQLTLRSPPMGGFDLNGLGDLETPEPDEKLETYFAGINGGPNGEFVLNDYDDDSSDDDNVQDSVTNAGGRKLEILYSKVPENLLTLVPFNIEAKENIKGSNGLIKARLLNNRRHVAVLDQSGSIYVLDIVSYKGW